eukprot:6479906-Amphidinium_carterae.1
MLSRNGAVKSVNQGAGKAAMRGRAPGARQQLSFIASGKVILGHEASMLPASSRGPRSSTSVAGANAVEGAGCRAAGRRGILAAGARRSDVHSALFAVEAVIARGRAVSAVVLHGSLVMQELRS